MPQTKRFTNSGTHRFYFLPLVSLLGLSLGISQPASAGRRNSKVVKVLNRANNKVKNAKRKAEQAVKKAAEETKKKAQEAKNKLEEATTVLIAEVKQPAYELAQGCFALKNTKNNKFLVAANGDEYKFADIDGADAEKFLLKPSSLGHFLLYDRNGRFLSIETPEEDFDIDVDLDINEFNFDSLDKALTFDFDIDLDDDVVSVKRKTRATQKAIWKINHFDIYKTHASLSEHKRQKVDTGYTLVSALSNTRLAMGLSKSKPSLLPMKISLKIDPTRSGFYLVEQDKSACKEFPEAKINATVFPEYYEPKDPNQPVVGFIDTHTHISFPKSMAGVAMVGDVFHPLGIEHALKDCSHLHGEGGNLDILGQSLGEGGGHKTAGYPDFSSDWPSAESVTHVNTYYKWIERAHLSGLKMLVTFVTGNKSICELLSMIHPFQAVGDCKSEDVIKLQIDYIYDLQDYVDAQEGGPGKGWFRIVRSPEEAREVISQNKLAVLLGTEYNTLFNCKVGADYCTPDYIDRELDKLHDMGVRVVYPMHKLDNNFGGAIAQGGSSSGWFNLSNNFESGDIDHFTEFANPFIDSTGGDFWQFEECPEDGVGVQGIQDMDEFMNNDFIITRKTLKGIPVVGPYLAEFFDWAFLDKLGPLPTYKEFGDNPMCNSRRLQPAGRHLINRLIDKGMLIETDHMGYFMLQEALEILEQRGYSGVISSHSISFLTDETVSRIFALGGHISPMARSFDKTMDFIERYSEEMSFYQDVVGVGLGTDVQGMCPQGDSPDGIDVYGDDGTFTSYDGTVEFSMQQTGNRVFNFNEEGRAHYGLLADWIEAVRQANPYAVDSIMNSAEAYLQTWERATR